MKRFFALSMLLTCHLATAQCPAPSDLSVTNQILETYLSWIENGTATSWEIAVVPDYVIGNPAPTTGYIVASANPFIVTNLSPGCHVFYVRSVCSSNEVSPWTLVASWGCPSEIYTYLATLSVDDSSDYIDTLTLSPNPVNKIIQLQNNSGIDQIIISDLSGKELIVQTQNANQVDVESLSKGIYIIEVFAGHEKYTRKFIKE